MNDADPFDYFYDLLWRINDHPVSRLDELLPDRWKPIRKPQDYWDTLGQDTTGKGWCWMGLAGCILLPSLRARPPVIGSAQFRLAAILIFIASYINFILSNYGNSK